MKVNHASYSWPLKELGPVLVTASQLSEEASKVIICRQIGQFFLYIYFFFNEVISEIVSHLRARELSW